MAAVDISYARLEVPAAPALVDIAYVRLTVPEVPAYVDVSYVRFTIPEDSAAGDGVSSGEAFGTPTVTPGPVTIYPEEPSGIESEEAFGTASLAIHSYVDISYLRWSVFAIAGVTPTGIASGEALGAPVVTPGSATASPSGIGTAEAFGTVTVSNDPGQTLTPTGIASLEGFGTPTVTTGAVVVTATGIPSEADFGRRIRVRRRHRRVVRPPTVDEHLVFLSGRPQPWSLARGTSLLKIDGTYHQVRWPSDEDIEAATAVYRGGFDTEVDDDEVADLTAAGYGDYIQLIDA